MDDTRYKLVKGDEVISVGTIEEIAKDQGVLEQTIKTYGTKAYMRRLNFRIYKRDTRLLLTMDDEYPNFTYRGNK